MRISRWTCALLILGVGGIGFCQEPKSEAKSEPKKKPPVVGGTEATPPSRAPGTGDGMPGEGDGFGDGSGQFYGPGSGRGAGRFDPFGGEGSGDYDAYGNPGLSWSSGMVRSDSERVGPYNQPVWTTQRPFASVRSYVLPPGTMGFEQWVRPTWNKHEAPEYRMLEEFTIGLPGRFQLDVYERWNIEQDENTGNNRAHHEGVQLEVRWALADWGVIPFNPTLYFEWIQRGGVQDKPDKFEPKLLLSEELLPNLYFATNLILEQEVADTRETEIGWNTAFSTTLIDRVLLGGIEMDYSNVTQAHHRHEHEDVFMLGPSLQLRPTNQTFLDVVALFGVTVDAPEVQMYVIFGYQFGTRAGPTSALPAGGRS